MKKFTKIATVAVMTMVTAGVFAGCGLKGGKDIGKEAALEAALADAGVRESDTTRLRVSSEIDDGRKVYEVRFDVEGTEYDYVISGRDGQILSADTERISTVDTTDRAGTTDTAGTADTAGTTDKEKSGNSQNNAEALGISIEEAEKIALERVPGASENDIRIQSDYDDGKYKYEGDIIYDGKEYEFEIDASTGTILEWSEERY